MIKITTAAFHTAVASFALIASATPSFAQRPSYWDGGRPENVDIRLVGAGVPILYPELRQTHRARAYVMRNFDLNADGRINPREARAANRAFAEAAGPRRDRFDWERHGGRSAEPRAGGWNRRAMRDYHFRQTPQGATLSLQEDVLFRTDSAELRPGALDKLEPLADYLRAEPGVRVAIVGHTDSRGTDAHNQNLSERRAESVRAAFDEMGVTPARFRVEGRGESQPVASNSTANGMRLNRRVEVTLLGQRADRFAAD